TSAVCVFSTSSTEGRLRSASVARVIARPSVSEQEVVDAGAAQTGLAHHEVEAERGDVVSHRIERRVLLLVEDLHVAAAFAAALGLDGAGTALDLLVRDALGRAADRALDAHVVP